MSDPTKPRLVVLGAAENPAVELVDLRTGERLPIPIGPKWGAFDEALPRQGWTAISIGYETLAIADEDLLRPVALPPAWHVVPANAANLVALSVYQNGGREEGEPAPILVVGSDGEVLRWSNIPLQALRGEMADGSFIASDGWWSASGQKLEGLPAGIPIGVVAAQTVVVWQAGAAGRGETPSTIVTVDIRTGSTDSIQVPLKHDPMSPRYNADASCFAVMELDVPGTLVVRNGDAPRWLEVPNGSTHAVWLDDEHLIFVNGKSTHVLDVGTGTIDTIGPAPKYVWPMCVATDRFDFDEIRARLVRPAAIAMTDSRRKALLAAEEERLRAAADEVGLDKAYIDAAEPAVRLRTWPPDITTLGTSRFGGHPDRPRGSRWPVRDGRPMAFLAQLDLVEVSACLPATGLPRQGLLQVFAAIESDGMYPIADDAVEVSVVVGELRRASWPRSLAEELRYSPADVSLEPMLSLPPWGHPAHDAQPDDSLERFDHAVAVTYASHRMFGLPDAVQQWEPTPGHVLLLQMDSDSLMQSGFGDGGHLRIWAPASPKSRVKVDRNGVIEGCKIDLDSM